jgi:hypothetical protein
VSGLRRVGRDERQIPIAAEDADQLVRKALKQIPVSLDASFARLVDERPLPISGVEVTRDRRSNFYEIPDNSK